MKNQEVTPLNFMGKQKKACICIIPVQQKQQDIGIQRES